MNTLLATLIVLALVGALAWLAKRGPLARLASAGKPVSVETAIPLGERRSLVIVAVEGRRLLLGLTSSNISLVTELKGSEQADQLPTANAQLPKGSWELPASARRLVARATSLGEVSPKRAPESQREGGGIGGWALTQSLGRLFRSGVSQ